MDTTPLQSNDATLPNAPTIIKSREELLKALPGYMTRPDCQRWLLHRNKVPYYANGSKRNGSLDSPKDQRQLVNFDEAYAVFSTGGYTGLGFALGFDDKGGNWQGIDLDDIWDKPELNTLKLPGYIESSPSGNGLHAIGYGQAFRSLGSNSTGIEAYSHGRYFTVTGNAFNELLGLEVPIQPICLANYVEQVLRSLHGTKVTQSTGLASNAPKSMMILSPEQMEDLRSALFSMPADDRDLWIAMGQALCRVEGGYELWAEWSATSVKHQGATDLARWDGFCGDKTSYEAVFLRAQDMGWINRRKRVSPNPAEIFVKKPEFTAPMITQQVPNFEWIEITIADVLTNPPLPPTFWIDQLLPAGLLTLLSAHGGTGKSMLALQAAVCLAQGIPFMGKTVTPCRVLFYSAEDSMEIIRHRIAKICTHMQVAPEMIAQNMRLIDATENPCLYEETTAGKHEVTPGYTKLQELVLSFNADVVIIDNASDTFNANENNRSHVRGFLRSLVRIGKNRRTIILLLTHIDKNTVQRNYNSEGYSGSTAWHNSARSRLYLTKTPDATLKIEHQKSNHGKLSEAISMTFSPDYILVHQAPEYTLTHNQDTIKDVLTILEEYYNKEIYVSDSSAATTKHPFDVLSAHSDFPKSIINKKQMNTLLTRAKADGYLVVEEYRNKQRKPESRYKVKPAEKI